MKQIREVMDQSWRRSYGIKMPVDLFFRLAERWTIYAYDHEGD